jgi:hypothetical protein
MHMELLPGLHCFARKQMHPAPTETQHCLAHQQLTPACHDPQYANAATLAGRPWASDAIIALLSGGLGSFWLAHAKSAAQKALRSAASAAAHAETLETRRRAANTVGGVIGGLTRPVACALAKRGLVGPLLQLGLYISLFLVLAK